MNTYKTQNDPESAQCLPMGKRKVLVDDLMKGMYVSELDRPWLESPFAFQGFTLDSAADIQAVQQLCDYVIVDVAKSDARVFEQSSAPKGRKPGRKVAANAQRQASKNSLSRMLSRFTTRTHKEPGLAEEVRNSVDASRTVFRDTSKLVRSIMDDVRLGKSIDTPAAKAAVSECVDQIIHNQDAMVLLSNIKDKDAYTSEHSMNVAILSIILGRKIGMPRDKLETLGLSAMLHDVGKVLTPDEVLKKPGKLTPKEFLIMKMHPSQGRDILLGSEGITAATLDVAHSHHERLDGSGYPRGLVDENISLDTKIVAITDTFDAITSDRIYDTGRTNIEAFKILQSCSGNRYRSDLVSHFIDAIGVYPAGSAVQLNNKQVGVVLKSNATHKLRPVVMILKDKDLKPVTPHYLDLADDTDNPGRRIAISRMVRASDVGVDTQAFKDPRLLRSLCE